MLVFFYAHRDTLTDMKLSECIYNTKTQEVVGSLDIEIQDISSDSRDIKGGSLFFAYKGQRFDGHQYISDAIEKGAVAIVCEKLPENLKERITYIQVEKVSELIGKIASNFFGNPSKELVIVGVTGTNGKTSIASSLYHAFKKAGKNSALFSTIALYFNDEKRESTHTTLDAISVQRNLREAVSLGITHVAMEVSSHALDQGRVEGVDFDVAIFSNLSHDHLDYHHTMEEYAASKKKLFDMLSSDAYAIYNHDDEYGAYMVSESKAKKLSYGSSNADYLISDISLEASGTTWKLNNENLETSHLGQFNVYNLSSVYVVLSVLGIENKKDIISQILGIEGRMQVVQGKGITGIVDYAHTPDALENALQTLRELPHRKIICIFGCGGDRDTKKRPEMALVAENNSDIIIVTSDNPRTEDQNKIFADIEQGFTKSSTGHAVITSREEAVRRSVDIAQEGDIILLAGKGHEKYQIIGTTKHPFDDIEVLAKYLKS